MFVFSPRVLVLSPHELLPQGYYQPAGPLISSHPGGQQPQSPLKSKADPMVVGSGLPAPQAQVPGQPAQHQVHQPTPTVGLGEHHRLDAGDPGAAAAANDLHRSQAFRYIPQPPGPYARPPIHQIHCTYPPPPPTYYAYGQHPQVRRRGFHCGDYLLSQRSFPGFPRGLPRIYDSK